VEILHLVELQVRAVLVCELVVLMALLLTVEMVVMEVLGVMLVELVELEAQLVEVAVTQK
jgi:hypothetical protein